ncbi:sigma-70 family RNA polymerase sigma factor [Gracilibacillus caseinilyticus]|uniref:Sigma-70 family RNA polymerase sigma factor n=1 Tax=Gracilibacillus caseinilyticus TaxID=2932256 RepID=A0ABY4EV08_9BACI|nr:sigma-70 family RNA polymerase sigma factor [Gracilibacillus caseinilyticus]UOQ48058.1 sigma-70 family RNA polymerase sigma factor [Gracilibacillus caseinilyticus]
METSEIFEELVGQYQSMMYYTALKIVKDAQMAEDVVQESWIKVFKHQLKLERIETLGSWLRTITSRSAIDLLRKEKRRNESLLSNEANLLEQLEQCSVKAVDDVLDWKFTFEYLEQLVNNKKLLPIFRMKFQLNLDDEQIAKQLNISHSAVKMRIFRTRKLIKQSYHVQSASTLKSGA